MSTLTIVNPPPPSRKYVLELDENEARAILTALTYIKGDRDTWNDYTFATWNALFDAGLEVFGVEYENDVIVALPKESV
jgi:hypothetical protein